MWAAATWQLDGMPLLCWSRLLLLVGEGVAAFALQTSVGALWTSAGSCRDICTEWTEDFKRGDDKKIIVNAS
jgi:hypothetical protein